jgi:hypothetical protein
MAFVQVVPQPQATATAPPQDAATAAPSSTWCCCRSNPFMDFEAFHRRVVAGDAPFVRKSLAAFFGTALLIGYCLPWILTGKRSFGDSRDECYGRASLYFETERPDSDIEDFAHFDISPIQYDPPSSPLPTPLTTLLTPHPAPPPPPLP